MQPGHVGGVHGGGAVTGGDGHGVHGPSFVVVLVPVPRWSWGRCCGGVTHRGFSGRGAWLPGPVVTGLPVAGASGRGRT